MSRAIHQPVASIKLTNVATVRLQKNGKRFEIACYKNKVLDYRDGLETDLSEVLQSERIFSNVGKGQFAASSDLKTCFPDLKSDEEIAKHILKHGKSLQISEMERNQRYENTLSQIATWISTNCIHSETTKSFTSSQIKNSLSNFNIQIHKPLKQQYLAALKYLQNTLPIQRAAMELQWTFETEQDEGEIIKALDSFHISYKSTKNQKTFVVDPSYYRPLHQTAIELSNSRLEILQQHVAVVTHLPPLEAKDDDEPKKEKPTEEQEKEPPNVDSKSSSSSDDEAYLMMASSRKNRKNQRKQQKKAQRRLQRQEDESSDGSSESEQEAPAISARLQRKQQQKAQRRQARKEEDDQTVEQKEETITEIKSEATESKAVSPPHDGEKKLTCNTCVGSEFASPAEYRSHFRSDWHRYNQKLKLKKIPPVSEQEFKQCDAESFFNSNLE